MRELAAFLAAVDVAPAGAVLDVAAGSAEHALLAAVYSTRLVRALEADPDRAHAARQTAATNALPVVVEERRLATSRSDAAESLDTYVRRTALEPALIRLGADTEAEGLLAGASDLLHRGRPWLVLESDHTAGGLLGQVSDLVALGYRVITETDISRAGSGYVLAPEGAETAFARRFEAWSAALLPAGPGHGAGRHARRARGDRRLDARDSENDDVGLHRFGSAPQIRRRSRDQLHPGPPSAARRPGPEGRRGDAPPASQGRAPAAVPRQLPVPGSAADVAAGRPVGSPRRGW